MSFDKSAVIFLSCHAAEQYAQEFWDFEKKVSEE